MKASRPRPWQQGRTAWSSSRAEQRGCGTPARRAVRSARWSADRRCRGRARRARGPGRNRAGHRVEGRLYRGLRAAVLEVGGAGALRRHHGRAQRRLRGAACGRMRGSRAACISPRRICPLQQAAGSCDRRWRRGRSVARRRSRRSPARAAARSAAARPSRARRDRRPRTPPRGPPGPPRSPARAPPARTGSRPGPRRPPAAERPAGPLPADRRGSKPVTTMGTRYRRQTASYSAVPMTVQTWPGPRKACTRLPGVLQR